MSSIVNQSGSSDRTSLPSTPRMSAPTATLLVGGSGVSCGSYGVDGQFREVFNTVPWDEILRDSSGEGAGPHALWGLFARVKQDLGTEISCLQISFAGPLETKGGKVYAHGTNLPVVFEEPLEDMMRWAAELNRLVVNRFSVVNDACAAVMGEMLAPEGAATDAEQALFLILGTGVGGALCRRDETSGLSPQNEFAEAGHTLLVDKHGVVSYQAMLQLAENGLYKDGTFYAPSDGRMFLEHVLGGPWLAAEYVKRLAYEAISVLKDPLGCLADELLDNGLCSEFDSTELGQALLAIAKLDKGDIGNWNRSGHEDVLTAVNLLIRQFGSLEDIGTLDDTGDKSILQIFARDLEVDRYGILTNALRSLRELFPEARIVLGSGVAQCRNKDPKFLDAIKGLAVLSTMSSIEREAAAALV